MKHMHIGNKNQYVMTVSTNWPLIEKWRQEVMTIDYHLEALKRIYGAYVSYQARYALWRPTPAQIDEMNSIKWELSRNIN
jgi:hypothetical protein